MTQLNLFNTEVSIKPHDGDTRFCTVCETEQPIENFYRKYRNTESGRNHNCKFCQAKESRVRKNLKKHHKKPGLDYICPICERSSEDVTSSKNTNRTGWSLDHCHNTGKFRGWLCHACNRALGSFQDDLNIVKKAVEYLKNTS